MSEIKLISPILDNYCIGDPISDKNGVRSCPAMKENEDDRYILKVISIPASQEKLEALLLAGAYTDAQAANAYFQDLTNALVKELEALNSFTEQDGFAPVRQWQVKPMDEGETGYDVYILTDYGRTLKRQFYKEPLTHLNAVNLGIDICAALTACRNAGYLYVDLKPTNILVNQDKRFKICDLGFIKMDSISYASLPDRYRSAYTAPEVADAFSSLSTNMDVYALGLVLYQTYNNGALPFSDEVAPAQVFEAPDYADYEMSEIILKACDPDPDKRWKDPAEMGQALVSYMQRNGANDTPIVPPAPVITIEAAAEECEESIPADSAEFEKTDASETAENPQEEIEREDIIEDNNTEPSESEASEDDISLAIENSDSFEDNDDDSMINLSFIDELDSNTDKDDTVNVDVAAIIDRADELAAHEVPDINSISIEEPSIDKVNEEAVEETNYNENQDTMIFTTNEEKEADTDMPDDHEESEEQQEEKDSEANPPSKKKRNHRWIGIVVAIAILIMLAAGAYCGYKFYYIKNIESITLDGKLDTLTVEVKSDADPSLLTVYCVGNGTRIPADIINGKATFTNLNPDQRYLVEIEISGIHGLKGKTSATYYSPSQVSLEGLLIQVGDTDGSAKLSFTTKKPYSGQWMVEYVTEDEEKQSVTSDSTNITLNNLTVGKNYDITIAPVSGNNWVTNNTGTFTAQAVIRAQDVAIADYKNGTLNIVWTCPTDVASWTVRCYNNTDYNKTVTVSDCAATFDGLDPAQNYTVEIYAYNQTQFQLLHIDDATLPVENFTAQLTEENFIELSWTCAKDIPEGGWIIDYTISELEDVFTVEGITENSCIVKDAIPGVTYTFTIRAANEAIVIANNAEITVAEAVAYTNNYGGTTFKGESIKFNMCKQPSDDNWKSSNLTFTNKFKADELLGFTTEALTYYNETVDAEIYILYIIRDENGELVTFCNQVVMWKELFNAYFGTLSVPQMPTEIGKYTLDIYYNGGYVTTQEFEVAE